MMTDVSCPHCAREAAGDGGKWAGTVPDFVPVPRMRARRGAVWTAKKQRDFIAALADTGSVQAAVRSVGMNFSAVYRLRRHPEGASFREAWEAALALGIAKLEDIAMDRALYGVEESVWHNGKAVGTRRVYDNKLLMFLLRNRSGQRFLADSWENSDITTRLSVERLKKRLRAEIVAEMEAERLREERTALASLNAKLERMRERMLGEAEEADGAEDAGPEDGGGEAAGAVEVKAVEQPVDAVRAAGAARILSHLLSAGDAALGLPRGWVPRAERVAMAARAAGLGARAGGGAGADGPSAGGVGDQVLVIPPSPEELAVAQWVRGEEFRVKLPPGVVRVEGMRKDGGGWKRE